MIWIITLHRSNGREAKSRKRKSKYAAKRLKKQWEDKYDDTYYVTVRES